MKRLLFPLVLILLILAAPPAFAADSPVQKIRIGAFNYFPGIFQAKDGTVQGFYVDFITEIARREGWQVEYVYGNWADGMARVKSGEVDILTSVAWTPERTRFLDYGKVPLLTVWGELYVPRRSQIDGIKDVAGKRVGVMKADFNGASFRNMVDKFGIACEFVEYGNFEEIFQATAAGLVDGGVVNNTFGAAKQHEYDLASSGIIFNPFDIYFAAAKGKNGEVLAALDRYLAQWRGSAVSPYHKARKRWSHGSAATMRVTPPWFFPVLFTCAVAAAAAAGLIVFLRRQVGRKSAEMGRQAADRSKIQETLFFINEFGSRHREDELLDGVNLYLCSCLGADYAFVAEVLPGTGRARTRSLLNREAPMENLEYEMAGTPSEVAQKGVCVYPEGVADLFPGDPILARMGITGYAAVPLRDSQGEGIGVLGILSGAPIANAPLVETVLSIASSRIAQELEAMRHLAELNLKDVSIEKINDAVYWITPEGKIWYVNAAACSMLGYRREELLAMSIPDLNPGVTQEDWAGLWEELKRAGGLRRESAHRAKNGSLVPVEITASYISYKGTEYSCAVTRDISERRRMEQALEHRLAVLTEPMANLSGIRVEDLFDLEELQAIQDTFADAMGVASLITDADGRPVTRPSNFCSLCSDVVRKSETGLANCMRSDRALGGMVATEPVMQPCLSAGLWDGGAAIHVGGHRIGNWLVGQVLDDSSDPEKLLSYADEIGADREEYRRALAQVTRMSREQFAKVCRALFQIAGQLSRLAVQNVQQAQHIAERRRAEELLLQYRQVIECSRDLICVVGRDYRCRLANSAFLEFHGKRLEEVIGCDPVEVLGEELFQRLKPHLDRCLAGKATSFEIQAQYPAHGARSLSVTYTPIEDGTGSIRVACVISDVTERKHLEDQLRQSQKMEAIGHLAGGIAHDFNNILTVIVGYGNFLELDGNLNPQQKDQVEQIIAAAEKGSQLTRGLLAFSRKQVMNPRVLDLNQLVNQIQKFLLRIIGEDVRLHFTPHPEPLHVLADASQLEQIMMNLATNARDAMPAGGVLRVETSLQEIEATYAESQGYLSPGGYACLAVSDNGRGMDRETRERIFEPFFSTKTVGKGTGLGMSIVYGIVKQHKGFVNVYSEPEAGTTFKIYFPVADQPAAAALQGESPEPPQAGSETILVAEDDASVRKLVESLLTRYGYRVILAVDGDDCVRKYREHGEEVSLILMDVIMPGKNGRDAFEEIRTFAPQARVLYSSGYTADFMKNRGVFDEPVDLIMKPVQPLALLKKVREVLER